MDSPFPPAESEIAAAVLRLRSRDQGTLAVVEPLARSLSRTNFLKVLETLEQRTSSGGVRNDTGLLVKLLRVAVQQEARRQAEADAESIAAAASDEPRQLGVVERTKRENPERYVAEMREAPGFDLESFLADYVDDAAERERLRRFAAADRLGVPA